MKSPLKNIKLTSYDELLNPAQPTENGEKIVELPLGELYAPQDHPFKIKNDEQMREMAESVKKYGVMTQAALTLVDEKKLAFRSSVEVSYLTKEEQELLAEAIDLNECTPSLAQALRLKQFSQEGRLNADVIEAIMSEEKPVERKLILDGKWITKRFPKEMTPKEIKERINKALDLLERTEKIKTER